MCGSVRVQGANHAQIVCKARDIRKETANGQPALAVLLEFKRRLHEMPHGAPVGSDFGFAGVRSAVEFRKGGFGVEGVDLTGAAIHEEEDTVFGLRLKMRGLGREGGSRAGIC